jgi:hypothetical protein
METDFSAKGPSLGYYFQIRYGLHLLLNHDGSDDSNLFFENLDDIEISEFNQNDLYQTKFHIKNSVNLTDRSTDLWKTIRVWAESVRNGKIKLSESNFTLITTAECAPESVFGRLREETIDAGIAVNELLEICKETSNHANLEGYRAFSRLNQYEQKELIERIVILDSTMNFDELENKIKKSLRFSVNRENMDSLFERLEGWWFGTSINQLNSDGINIIDLGTLRNKILDITSKMTSDNLPIDFDTKINISDTEFIDFSDRSFVKKLAEIGINKASLKNAISDYLRTFKQRSKWIRENLLDPDDEHKYEEKLYEEWETKFDFLEDLIDGKDDEEILKIGNSFYTKLYSENLPQIFIRPKVTDSFLVRGSYQILAEEEKIGFNPNFKNRK